MWILNKERGSIKKSQNSVSKIPEMEKGNKEKENNKH